MIRAAVTIAASPAAWPSTSLICFRLLRSNSQNAVIYTHDSYNSFRDQLVAFIHFLRTGERPFPWQETVELMKLLIGGIESREQNGKEILI